MTEEIHDWTREGQIYLRLLYQAFSMHFPRLRVLNLTVGKGYTLRFYPDNVEEVVGVDKSPRVTPGPKLKVIKSDYFKALEALDLTRFNVVEIDPFSTMDSIRLLIRVLEKKSSQGIGTKLGYHITLFTTPLKRRAVMDFGVLGLGRGRVKADYNKLPYMVAGEIEERGWKHKLFIYQYESNTFHMGGVIEKTKIVSSSFVPLSSFVEGVNR